MFYLLSSETMMTHREKTKNDQDAYVINEANQSFLKNVSIVIVQEVNERKNQVYRNDAGKNKRDLCIS